MFKEIKKWKEISRENIFQKYGRKIDKVVFELQDGNEEEYYIKNEGKTVAVLALTKDKKVILVKQYRPGPNKILLELPGGVVDSDESVICAGARELVEESGYEGDIELVTDLDDDGYSNRLKHCVVATNCKKVAEQKLDETEFINVQLVSINEFRKILRSGRGTDIEIGYLGLDFLNLL